ncbi:hypothetical protein [Planococcus sp. S3-L1]|uniref:hypothetical protein n=1 Tax=Planococcus sp. S3-L1 TaxID=3046200 RepID=UPI0024BABC7C|nr:hypothetical protein [Planococcus sp. S3-L1]MDJ0333560.1 hypothetical protein [Planococcus sp. S3-L1]
MKKKHFFNLGLIFLTFGLVIPTVFAKDGERRAQKTIEANQYIFGLPKAAMKIEEKPYLVMYDKNKQPIQSYSEEQLKELITEMHIYKDSEESQNGEPYAEIFDENGLLLNLSADIEKEVKELSVAGAHNLFVFRQSSFSNQLSIGQGKIFDQPKSLIIEPVEEIEILNVNLIDTTGEIIGSLELNNFTESLKIPLDFYTEDSPYSIQLINKSQKESVDLIGGVVIYN